MTVKFSRLSAAVISMMVSIHANAMEPLDMKRVTDTDKMYFGNRLTPDQIKKLQQISVDGFATGKLPCDKVIEINKTLHFLHNVTPVFRQASTDDNISPYTRKYSSALAHEFAETTKVLGDILPRYKKLCTAGKQKRHDSTVTQN